MFTSASSWKHQLNLLSNWCDSYDIWNALISSTVSWPLTLRSDLWGRTQHAKIWKTLTQIIIRLCHCNFVFSCSQYNLVLKDIMCTGFCLSLWDTENWGLDYVAWTILMLTLVQEIGVWCSMQYDFTLCLHLQWIIANSKQPKNHRKSVLTDSQGQLVILQLYYL